MLTDELPDRFGFELLRSTFKLVDQRMNSAEQDVRFVGLGMLRSNGKVPFPAMSALTRCATAESRNGRLVIASMRAWGFPSRTNKLHQL